MITRKSIEDVTQAARIEEVVGDYVNLKRRGVNLIGLCPFHDEKTPSFTVSPAKNIFKCFGCSKGGDPVGFIMEHESLSYIEAIRFLAQRYNIAIEETELTDKEKELKSVTDTMYIINHVAKDHFKNNLWSREEGQKIGLAYFKERGFRDFIIQKFELGYALDERDDFTEFAGKKPLNTEVCKNLGLISSSGHDFYRARVMFPIHGTSGKILGFGGRTLSADKKVPKYINSPESDIYNKRNTLYGLFFAKEAIRKQDECILVEGYTDVISLHQGEINHVVAASGTSLTQEQIKLIKRYTSNITMIFDGDPAGIKASMRGLDMVLEADMNVRLVLLPDGEDPDSFLNKTGSQSFTTFLKEKSEDFLFFKTRILLQDAANDPIRKAGALKNIVESIAKISDAIKRAIYIQQCSIMMNMDEAILVRETNKYIKESFKKKRLTEDNTPQSPEAEWEWIREKKTGGNQSLPINDSDDAVETALAQILIKFGDQSLENEGGRTLAVVLSNMFKDIISLLDNVLVKEILTFTSQQLTKGKTFSSQWFITHEEEEIRNFAVDALSSPYEYAKWEDKGMLLQTQKMPDENYERDFENVLLRLKLRKAIKGIKEIEKELLQYKEGEHDAEEYLLQIKVLQALKKERNEMAEILGTVIF